MTPRFLVVLILVSLGACGGGGGGSTPDGGGIGGDVPPSLDTVYTGNKAQAQVVEANHAVVAEAAWFGPLTAFVLAQDIVTEEVPDGPLNETNSGSGGGTARISGRISNGTGTLTLTYSNFNDGGVTLDGTETMSILTRRTMNAGSVRRSFDGLSVRSDGTTTTLYGTLTRTDSTPVGSRFVGSTWQISGDLVMKQGGEQVRISALSLTRTWHEENLYYQYSLLTGSARVFDAAQGYFDVAFESPVHLVPDFPEGEPATGGSLAVTGAGGTKLWVSPLSKTHVAVELADAGATQPTRSVVYRWEDDFDRPAGATRTAPLTIAGPDMFLGAEAVGTPIPLEGRFSEAGGSGLVTHDWRLMLSPPGSQATVSNAGSTRPTLLADVEGAYLLRLRTSDGVNDSFDFLTVYAAAADGTQWEQPVRLQMVLPRFQQLPAGSLATIESGRNYMTDGSTPVAPRWIIEKPLGVADYVTQSAATAQFIVDAEQDYQAYFMDRSTYAGPISAVNRAWVSAPGNVRFAPPLGMHTRRQSSYLMSGEIQAVDIDGNGHPDLVEERYAFDTQSMIYTMLLNRGGGRFETYTQQLQGGAYTFGEVGTVFADVDGDQRIDLLVPDLRGVLVSRQSSGGPFGFGAFTVLPEAVNCGTPGFAPEAIVVLDVDRDGRKDIVASSPCSASFPLWVYINDPAEPSGFRAAVTLPIAPSIRRFAAGDVDGDGFEDLVGYEDGAGNTLLHVWRNLPGGTFQLLNTLTLAPSQVNSHRPVLFADMNADGRSDIVFSGNTGVEVILVGAGGALTQRPPVLMYTSGGSARTERLRIVDLNRDGRLDLANSNGWRRQLPGGDFGPLRPFTADLVASAIVDLNGDGLLDLVGSQGPFIALGAE